ncbi:MAG TPA: tetratricopeptide repeat protein [Thermohalobaculum sp.]|nr:tetratricopeptide repeat protein [Thermohalobaculum sp.]
MAEYYAAVFVDLERHSRMWTRTSRANAVAIIAEYRYLAERTASQLGVLHRNFTGDGHLFLFRDANAAADFGARLIAEWERCCETVPVLREAPRIALRVGCHIGECFALGDDWIGRGIALAKRVEAAAQPGALHVTENVLELVDLVRFEFEPAGEHALKGDFLPRRRLYRLRPKAPEPGGERPETAGALFLRAVASEDPAEEVALLRRALELRPDYPEAHNNLAVALRRAGDLEGAARHYREALRLRPDYPEAHCNYAFLLEALGRTEGALQHAREAVRLRPDYVDAHHRLANLLAARGDLEAAAVHYERALDLRPTAAEVHNNYAVVLERRGRAELAQAHYRQAIRLKPDYAPAFYNCGLLLEETGAREEAEAHYRRALAIWPDYPEAHNNLAILLHQSGRLAEAETHYRAAAELRQNDPEAHYNLALLLQALGREDEAERHFAAARELAPAADQFTSPIETPD